MRLRVALPGAHHMPGVPAWVPALRAPDFQRFARAADELGYDAISVSEHMVMPLWEVPRLGPHWLHALTGMSFLAGATTRIRVDATVMVLPYHHPVDLAKAVASLDLLSGGRVDVSIGVGHAEQEFAALGQSFADRGAVTDEALQVMKLCWSESEPVFEGKFFNLSGVAFAPHPVQEPRPPIYVGGNAKPALRRAARHEGWQPNPLRITPEEIRSSLDYIAAQPEFEGKEGRFQVHLGIPGMRPDFERFGAASGAERRAFRERMLEGAGRFAGLGVTVTYFPMLPCASLDEFIDAIRWGAEEILPALRDL